MKMKFLLVIAALLLPGLACSVVAELGCYADGGTWVDTEFSDGERVPAYCIPKQEIEEQENISEQNTADNNDEKAPPPDPAASQACDATALLKISYTSPTTTEYEDGTKICEYDVSITNTHDASVWVWVDLHIFEGDEGIEYFQWTEGEHAKTSGLELIFNASFTLYDDPDYLGPNAKLPVRAAAIYKTDECTPLKDNNAYVEQIAVPLTVYCPTE